MGLKDWFAGNILGPQGYGGAMGRQARENGSVLANAVFRSHGVGPDAGPTVIFDTPAEMEAAGFKRRYDAVVEIAPESLSEDEKLLLKSLATGMISYAFIVNSNMGLQSMRRDNTSKFRNGLGPSLLQSMVDCGLFAKHETARVAVLGYTEAIGASSPTSILDTEKSGQGGLLEQFILRAVGLAGITSRYGFTRTGITGFDWIARPLVDETLKAIARTALDYRW